MAKTLYVNNGVITEEEREKKNLETHPITSSPNTFYVNDGYLIEDDIITKLAQEKVKNDMANLIANAVAGSVRTVDRVGRDIQKKGYNPYAPDNSLAGQMMGGISNAVYGMKDYAQSVQNGDIKPLNYFTSNDLAKAKEDREKDEWLRNNQMELSYGQELEKAVHDYMSPAQSAIYNKLYDTYGREEAEKYFNSVKNEANARFTQKHKEEWEKAGEEHPLGTSIVSVFTNMGKPMEYLHRLAQKATTGRIDENDPMGNLATNATNYGRMGATKTISEHPEYALDPIIRQEMLSQGYDEEAIRKAIEESHKNTEVNKLTGQGLGFLYNTGMSMVDFLAGSLPARGIAEGTAAMSKVAQKLGEFVSLTPMGMSAAQDATIHAKERGLSEDQAVVEGMIAGVLEQATEMFSVEALLNPSKSLMKGNKLGYVLKNALAEGGEEVASDIGNMIADHIIAGNRSELKARMKELKSEHKDWSDAKAWWTAQAEQIAPDFFGGALSGFVMGKVGAEFNSYNNTKMLNDYASDIKMPIDYRDMENFKPIVEMAMENESSSTSHQIAETLQAKIENGEGITDNDIGGLLQAINEEDIDANRPKLRQEIARFLEERELKKYQRELEEQEKAEPTAEQKEFMENTPLSMANDNRLFNPMDERKNYLTYDDDGKLMFKADRNETGIRGYAPQQEIANTESLSADELRAKYGGNPATDTVALLTADMPKQEQYIINNFYDKKSDPFTYVADMREARRAGIAGEDINSIQSSLNEAQKKAAYELGRSDLNELRLRESGKWSDGENTRGQVRTVEQSTGFEKNIKGNADSELSALDLGENDEVQVALTDERGKSRVMAYIPVKDGIETKKMSAAKKIAEAIGYDIVFTNGLQRYGDKYARGTIDTDKKVMYIQANHPVFNAEQIAKHEEMHERIAKGEVDIGDVLLRITSRLGEDKVKEMLDDYRDAYDGSGMSDEYVIEEIICDANGGINIFAEANDILAKKFAPQLEAVKSETEKSKNNQPNAPPKTDKRALRLSEEIKIALRNNSIEGEVASFGIERYNDFIHVQKRILDTLKNENFYPSEPIKNNNSGMEIYLTPKGIKETFGKGKRYQTIPNELKRLKIATVRSLPNVIKNAIRINDNVPNFHKSDGKPYAYFSMPCEIAGEKYTIRFDVQKGIQKNVFWVHYVDITKDTQTTHPSMGYNEAKVSDDIETQKNKNVNKKGSLKLSEESESLAEMRKANKELEKELLNATKEIEKWKKKYNITSPLKANYHDAELIAKDFIKRYGSNKSVQEITRKIVELGDYILNSSRDNNMSPEDYMSQLRDKAIDVAGDLVLTSKELTDESDYNAIRQLLESGVRISPADRDGITTRNVKIANNGKNISDIYDTLSEKYSWYFPSEITDPVEQLMQIDDVIDDIRPYYENSYSQYGFALSEITNAIANELIADASFGQIQPQNMGQRVNELTKELKKAQAEAQKNAEKIEELKAQQEEKIADLKATEKEKRDKLREQKNERIEENKSKYREASNARIEKFKAQKEENIKNLKENFKDREKRGKDRRKAKELRAKIEKKVKQFSKKLLSPTKAHHITERQDPKLDSLKATTAKILSMINLESSYNVDEEGKHVKEGGFPTKKTMAWDRLKKQYDSIVEDSNYLTDEALVGDNGWLNQISKFADTPITKLGLEELNIIYNTLSSLETTLTMSDKAFAAMKGKNISEIVHALFDENMEKKAHKIYGLGKKRGSDPLEFLNDVSVDLLDAHSFFHRLGKTGDQLFRSLRKSQDNSFKFYQQVKLWVDENLDMDLDKAVSTTVPVTLGGKTVDLTLGELMELYATSKREQGRRHLLNGGFKRLDAKQKKNFIFLESDEKTYNNITPQELDNAANILTAKFPEYRNAVDAMQKFMSTTGADYGNAASERTYGYKKFEDDNYWKLRVDRDTLNSNIDNYQNKVTTVGNKGMSKPVNPNATKPVYIGNAFDTFLDMVVEMGDYGSYLEITEDMNRIFNYNNTKEDINTKRIIRHALGTKGENYWLNLMRDVSNASVAMNNFYGGAANTALGAFKAGAVGGNLRVIVQQPTAILRAMDMIDGKYLAMGVNRPFKGMETAKKYAPIAWWKDQGYYNLSSGRTLHDLLFDDPSKIKRTSEFLMKGAGTADNFAWGILWNAVEAETKDKTNLKVGSEEYYEHCAERFSEIIDASQVVDGVLQRAGVMRKTDIYSKMATAFMGEPLKQLNQFKNAWYDYRNGNGSKKLVLMTVKAMTSAAVLNAFVKSLIDAMRHSEREKKYWDKVAEEFWGLTGDENGALEVFMSALINGFLKGEGNAYEMFDLPQYIPFARDVESMIRGHDVERSDLSVLGAIKKAAENLGKTMSGEGKDSIFSALSTFLGETSKLTGVPAGNVMRDVYSVFNSSFNEFGSDNVVYNWNKLFFNIDAVDKSGNKKNKTLFMDLLYKAWADGHDEDFKLMYEDMKKHFSTKEFQNYWDKKLKEEQGTNDIKAVEGKVNFKTGDIGKHTTISAEKKAENEKATAEAKEAKEKKEEHEEDLDALYKMWVNNDPSFNSTYNSLKEEIEPDEFQNVWDTNMKEEQGVDNVKNLEGRVNFARGDIGKHTTISAAKKAENEKATAEAKAKKEAKEKASADLYSNPVYKQVSSSSVWKQATSDMQKTTEDSIVGLTTGTDADLQAHVDVAKKYGVSESQWLLYHLACKVVDKPNANGNMGTYTNAERAEAAQLAGFSLAKVNAINKEVNNEKKQAAKKK